MHNQNGRAGDVIFAKAFYGFLINGEHLSTRKLRVLIEQKLGQEVPTQKIAQFVYNKKASGILALDDDKNNYLTEFGLSEAKKLFEQDEDNTDLQTDSPDFVEEPQEPELIYSETNTGLQIDSIYKQLSDIYSQISDLKIGDFTVAEYEKVKKIYMALEGILK